MTLCLKCECVNINGTRCHERGCPNEHEQIYLVDDGTLDTVFRCQTCGEEMRYTRDCDDDRDYDEFVLDTLHELQDEHECYEDEV